MQSPAGGLGILATGPLNAKATGDAIDEIRRLTDKPFAIGATLLMPGASENVEVAIEKKVPVVNFSLGKGDEIVRRVHAYGGKVIATVVSEKHARSAIASGVDALMVTGIVHVHVHTHVHLHTDVNVHIHIHIHILTQTHILIDNSRVSGLRMRGCTKRG